jgi:DNA-binding Xre family transcriptional regulator
MIKRTDFGRDVQVELALRDWTAQQLAEQIGCTRQAINLVLIGKRKSKRLREKICKVLDMEVKDYE